MTKNILVLISGSGTNLQALIDASAAAKYQKNNVSDALTLDANIIQVISSSPAAYGLTRAANSGIPTTVHSLKDYYRGIEKTDKEARQIARNKFDLELANLIIYGNKSGNSKLSSIEEQPKESNQENCENNDKPVNVETKKIVTNDDEDLKIDLQSLSISESKKSHIKPDLIVCAGWMLILSPSILTPLAEADIPIINLHPALPGAFDGTHAIERAWQAYQDGTVEKCGLMIHKVIAEVDAGEPLIVKEVECIKGEPVEDYEARVHKVEHIAIVEGTTVALKTLVK